MKASTQFRKKLLASLINTAVIAVASAPMVSWAQSANANLRGKAPASATVTARNIATGTVRRATAGTDGGYTLVGLPPGTYRVDAGPGTEHTVTLTVASTATLDLSAAAAAASTVNATNLSGVTVSAATLTEVKTSEVGSTISLHQINTIPQVSRNFLEFADTVPGMVFSLDSSGHTSLRGGAQNNSSVNVYIDGVGQKSYVKEGGVSGQFSSQGNPFPQLAIGEYKVITSNYKAEYDQISSAAVTADTKSGTNEFHGEVFGTYTNDSLRARTPSENDAGRKTQSHEKEYGFAIGGPIIQDKMHFFFTYEAKKFDTPITVTPNGEIPDAASLLPADVVAQLGPADLPFKEYLYFGKIDWEPTDRDRFELSGQLRKEDQYDNIGDQTTTSAGIDTLNNDTRFALRWQHSGDAYFNELLFTHEKAYNNPTPLTFGNGAVYTYGPQNDATIVTTGPANTLATQKKGQKGPALQDDLTLNDLEWHGDHVVKMGLKYKLVDLNAQDAGDINPQFFYDVEPGTGTQTQPWKVFFPNPVPGLNPVAKSSDRQFGVYIQDDWALNDKLTLNLGVRWDYEKNPSYLNYVTPANVVAALNSPNPDPAAPPGQTYAQALALGGVDVNDYISNGHNRHAYKGEIQPRLGFSYDLNGDEAHVIFGGAGRAYDRDLYDYLQVEQTKAALPQSTVYFRDPSTGLCRGNNATPCIDFNPAYMSGLQNLQSLLSSTNAGNEVDAINNQLRVPYSDQFSIGMRNKLGDWNTSVAVARILSHDGFVFTLGNRYPNGDFYQNCGVNCYSQPWGNGIPGFGSLIIGNNGIETRTTQMLLSAEKPYTRDSGWGATFAYTYTRATQNRDINEHYAFDEATIHQYPFIDSNAAARHRFVATGVTDIPWGITLSAKLTLATPIPGNTISCYADVLFDTGTNCTPAAANPGGTGKFLVGGKVFGYRDVDLQATKDFDLGHGISIYGRFDVLNLFNWKNYDDLNYIVTSSGGVGRTTAMYNPIGNITFVPRTIKFTVGMKF
jgi:outer membrane receptor protein involved in Fe transport